MLHQEALMIPVTRFTLARPASFDHAARPLASRTPLGFGKDATDNETPQKIPFKKRLRKLFDRFGHLIYLGGFLTTAATSAGGYAYTQNQPVAHMRQTYQVEAQALNELSDLRSNNPTPSLDMAAQEKAVGNAKLVMDNIAAFNGKPNPALLSQLGLSPEEIAFSQKVLQDARTFEGVQGAEALHTLWADTVLAKRMNPEELATHKAEAKVFFQSNRWNQTAETALYWSMVASLGFTAAPFALFGLLALVYKSGKPFD